MTFSSHPPDNSESFELPDRDRTLGPLALILASLRTPAKLVSDEISALATSGTLNATQSEHLTHAMNAIGQILRTVERYATPIEVLTRRPTQPLIRAEEPWSAGEQSDALDDRYQDAAHPLSDEPSHDSEG